MLELLRQKYPAKDSIFDHKYRQFLLAEWKPIYRRIIAQY